MAQIHDPQLSIQIDHAAQTARVSVSCDVEFTDFKMNSMNLLGFLYTLECQLLNMEHLSPQAVMTFDPQQFPRIRDGARLHEHTVFEASAPTNELHVYLFRKDSLLAELRLSNEDLGTLNVKRTPTMFVDLAAQAN
jgi:hypothetical protein